jgi:hypothetical protein
MSQTKLRALIGTHRCRVNGVEYRFTLELFAVEPKWTGGRVLLSVRVAGDSPVDVDGAVLNILLQSRASSADVLSLLNDALAAQLANGGPSAIVESAATRTAVIARATLPREGNSRGAIRARGSCLEPAAVRRGTRAQRLAT